MRFANDFLLAGIVSAMSTILTAPIQHAKLTLETQDANPRVMSGEIPRYRGIGDAFSRIYAQEGPQAFYKYVSAWDMLIRGARSYGLPFALVCAAGRYRTYGEL